MLPSGIENPLTVRWGSGVFNNYSQCCTVIFSHQVCYLFMVKFDPRPYQLISCQIFVSHSYYVSIMLDAAAMELDFNCDQWKLSLFSLNRL